MKIRVLVLMLLLFSTSSCTLLKTVKTTLDIEQWDVPTVLHKIDDFVPITNIIAEQIYLANCTKEGANETLDRFVDVRNQIQSAKFVAGNAYAAYKSGEKGDISGALLPLVQSVGDIIKLIEQHQGQQYLEAKHWALLGTMTNLAELGMSKLDTQSKTGNVPILKQFDFESWAMGLKARCSQSLPVIKDATPSN